MFHKSKLISLIIQYANADDSGIANAIIIENTAAVNNAEVGVLLQNLRGGIL